MNAPTAPGILQAGLGHMLDRAATYDKPQGERSMGATVTAFNAVTGLTLTEEQGWLFQILLKAVRSQQGNYRLDNYEDGAAYFGLMGEAGHRDRVVMPMLTDCLMGKRDCTCERCTAKATDPVYAATQDGFDEARADAIGQNGNDGEHYASVSQQAPQSFRNDPSFKELADILSAPDKPDGELPNTDALVDPTGRPKWKDVPGWVNWIGQDRKGVWSGFAHKPEPRQGRWFSAKRFIELNSGDLLAGEDWVNTLEQRP